jgi:hypothetical protein
MKRHFGKKARRPVILIGPLQYGYDDVRAAFERTKRGGPPDVLEGLLSQRKRI